MSVYELGFHRSDLGEVSRDGQGSKCRIRTTQESPPELADGVVITRGQERCLYVFSAKEFQDVHDKVRQAPVTSEEARRYLRVFLSGASDETPDKQGRVLVPAMLREYADLTKELVIIGVGSRAEIWDAAAWQTYLSSNEETFASQAQEVIPGLF